MSPVFFDSWSDVLRPLIVGVLAYTALIMLLRASGKRTLTKMNAFDLIVTVALGSTLATILLSEDVALAEGIMAFVTLIGLQFLITWLQRRSTTVRDLVKAEPTMVFHRGAMLENAMRRERVIEAEVYAAIRGQGLGTIDQVEAVVLETDGSFSVVQRTPGASTTLEDVAHRDD